MNISDITRLNDTLPELKPKSYTVDIPSWHPATINQLLGGNRWRAHRLKKSDQGIIAHYCRTVPLAKIRRRVELTITLRYRQRAADADAYWKSLLDALVKAKMLVNDSHHWVELAPVKYVRGNDVWGSKLVLSDIGGRA